MRLTDLHHRLAVGTALPESLCFAVDQAQPFFGRPVIVVAEQFQLRDEVSFQVVGRLFAADQLDEGLDVLIDLEPLQCVGEQRRHLTGIHMHLA